MTKEERRLLILRRTAATNVRRKALTRKTGGLRGSGSGGHRPWSQREDRIIKRTDISIDEMVRLTGRTFKAVDCRRNKLPGVKRIRNVKP